MTTNPGTTNIAELPFNNVPLNSVEDGGNNVIENKIQNELNNRDQQTQIINNPNKELSNNLETNQNNNQMDYNSMINDLQKASQSGVTSLPSRDIPMNTNNIVQDEQVQPNFIPENNNDYIGNNIMIDNTINDNNSNINRLDKFYDNLQTPILLSILYFIFQLPIFKKYLLKYIPSLFKKDGNQNIYGYLFYSILFGTSYVVVNTLILRLNEL
tara:strand:+ start:1458 stop:2096 length:639 start_codon:yes stop_codon:yes gene_type:complete